MERERKNEWFDDDGFWEELFPFMFGDWRIGEAEQQSDALLALAAPAGRRVLDLCCGPGRFSVAMAKRGFKVTGVDRTTFLLDKAKSHASNSGTEVEFVQCDMRDFMRPEAFDLALSMFTSFGYFDDKGEDLRVLRNIHTSLVDGGRLVLDVMGKERIAKIFLKTVCDTLEDGSMLLQKHEIFDDWTRIRNEWIVIRDGKTRSFKFHHTVYSGEELRSLLFRAGFREVKLYGDYDGSVYGVDARRLVAIAAK